MTPPSLVPAPEDYGTRPAEESPRLCWYPGAESYRSILQGGKDAPAHCCCSAGQAVGLAYNMGLQYTCPRVPRKRGCEQCRLSVQADCCPRVGLTCPTTQ